MHIQLAILGAIPALIALSIAQDVEAVEAVGGPLYQRYTNQPPAVNGRCGPFYGNAGCWPKNWCTDLGWCQPIDPKTPELFSWVGNWHYYDPVAQLETGRVPTCDAGNDLCAQYSAKLGMKVCCDLGQNGFAAGPLNPHEHYCAFVVPGMNDDCGGTTNFNDKPLSPASSTIAPASTALPPITTARPTKAPTAGPTSNASSTFSFTLVTVVMTLGAILVAAL